MTTHLTNKIANDLYLIGELQARSADQLPERKFHEQTFTHTYIYVHLEKKKKSPCFSCVAARGLVAARGVAAGRGGAAT